jgi:hypothetical protein
LPSVDELWAHLGTSSVFTSLLTAGIGGILAAFKPYLPNEDKLRERIAYRRQVLKEGVNKSLNGVIMAGLRLEGNLRGTPPNEPDLVGDYTTEFVRVLSVTAKLDQLWKRVKRSYACLFTSAAIGVFCFLLGLIVAAARPALGLISCLLILFQIGIVFVLRRSDSALDSYETDT